jgi:hypothetical protein
LQPRRILAQNPMAGARANPQAVMGYWTFYLGIPGI